MWFIQGFCIQNGVVISTTFVVGLVFYLFYEIEEIFHRTAIVLAQ